MKPKIETGTDARILVRGTNWVGDAVMTMPALSAIRQNFPLGHIAVLARPWVLPVYAGHPAVDRVIPYESGNGALQTVKRRVRAIRQIQTQGYELAVLFQNAFEAALTVFLGRIPRRIGYDTDGRSLLLTHPVRRRQLDKDRHQVHYYLSLLASMGWQAPYQAPCLHVSAADDDLAGTELARLGIGPQDLLLGLCPGAIYGPTKRWPAQRFARVGEWAARRWGARVVLMGSRSEGPICAEVGNAMGEPALNLCGALPLGAAMGIIRRCALVVTNDSGLMHVAAGLGVPTVAVFGSTDPVATGPLGPFTRVVRTEIPCSPCFLRTCPLDFGCMLKISPEMVWEAMHDLRSQADGPASSPER